MTKFYVVLLLVLVLHNAFFINFAFAASPDGCDVLSLAFDCDLSGWMGLILGDMAIAASMALFLHYLAHRSNAKIEQNSKAIKNNNIAIQKILTDQQDMKNRRQVYVIQSFKNEFSSLLLCIGIIHKSQDKPTHNEDSNQNNFGSQAMQGQKEIENILRRSQNTLNLSIDVLDPMLIDQIEQFLLIVEQQLLADLQNKKSFDYKYFKNTIMHLTQRLNDYSHSDSILK